MASTDQEASLLEVRALAPELGRPVIEAAAVEAVQSGASLVCVQPEHVEFVVGLLSGRLPVCGVVGHPHGGSLPQVKAAEAASVVAAGAAAVEVVVALGPITDGDIEHVAHEIAVVRSAVPATVLRVVIESALWAPAVLRGVVDAAVSGGADVLVTSTGFHPAGGASTDAVATMVAAAGGRTGVVATGIVAGGPTPLDLAAAGANAVAIDHGASGATPASDGR